MIHEKLQKARVELQDKQLKKSGKNKFAGFTYYELADIIPTINKMFLDLKLSSNFSIKDDLATLVITDWEDGSKEEFTSPKETLELKGCTKVQALGGVHTYLKRYLYLNALEIVEADMLDAQAGNIEEPTRQKSKSTQKATNPDADLDLLQGLYATNSTTSAETYYKTYKDNAVLPEIFKQEYAKHYTKLKKAGK